MVVVPICHWVLNLAILIPACAGERDEKPPTSGAERLLVGGEIWTGSGRFWTGQMAVLGFGSRDTAASGGSYIAFCFIFSYFYFIFFSRFQTDGGGGEFRWWEVVNLTGTCIRDLLPEIRVEVV